MAGSPRFSAFSAFLIRRGWLVAGLLGAALYLPATFYDFTYDDLIIIRDNRRIQHLGDFKAYLGTSYWDRSGQNKEYRPLTMLGYAANFALSGKNPISYHLINAVLHGLVCSAAWMLVWALFGCAGLATGVAALFAVHPIHVEAVAGVVGRAELTTSLGLLLALVFGIYSFRAESTGRQWSWAFAASLAAALAIGSKENGLTVVPALVLIPFFAEGERRKAKGEGEANLRLSPFAFRLAQIFPSLILSAIPLVVYIIVRRAVLGGLSGPPNERQIFEFDNPLAGLSGVPRLLSALKMLTRYALMLVWPFHPSPDYSYGAIPMVLRANDPSWIIGALLIPLFLWGGWALRRRPAAFFGVWIFFVTFVITSNIFFPIGTMLAERLLYLPSFGFCLFAVDLIGGAMERMKTSERPAIFAKVILAIAILWGSAFALQTLLYLPTWKNNKVLFNYMVRRVPTSARAHLNIGYDLLENDRNFPEAIAHFQRALEIMPEQPSVLGSLGKAYFLSGKMKEAQQLLEEGRKEFPFDDSIAMSLARVYAAQGRRDEAEQLYQPFLAEQPRNLTLLRDYALLLVENGKSREAIAELEKVLAKTGEEDDAEVFIGLAKSHLKLGHYAEAESWLRKTLRLRPDDTEARFYLLQALMQLGKLDEAGAIADDLLKLKPNWDSVKKLLEEIQRRKNR